MSNFYHVPVLPVPLICAARPKSKGKKKNEGPSRDENTMGMNRSLIEFENFEEEEGIQPEEEDGNGSYCGRCFFIDDQQCERNRRILFVDINGLNYYFY